MINTRYIFKISPTYNHLGRRFTIGLIVYRVRNPLHDNARTKEDVLDMLKANLTIWTTRTSR